MPAVIVEVYWARRARDDRDYWRRRDRRIAKKIENLIKDIHRDPFTGLGKPESVAS